MIQGNEYVFFIRKMHEVDVIQASPVSPFILLKRNYTKFVEATPLLELYSAVFLCIPPNLSRLSASLHLVFRPPVPPSPPPHHSPSVSGT